MADEDHDYTMAVAVVGEMKEQMTTLARSIVLALTDGKVSTMEGIMLGMKGIQFALAVGSVLGRQEPQHLQDILYVLEHGVVHLESS